MRRRVRGAAFVERSERRRPKRKRRPAPRCLSRRTAASAPRARRRRASRGARPRATPRSASLSSAATAPSWARTTVPRSSAVSRGITGSVWTTTTVVVVDATVVVVVLPPATVVVVCACSGSSGRASTGNWFRHRQHQVVPDVGGERHRRRAGRDRRRRGSSSTIDTCTGPSQPVSVSLIVHVAGRDAALPDDVRAGAARARSAARCRCRAGASGQVMWNWAGRVHELVSPVTIFWPRIAARVDRVGERAGDVRRLVGERDDRTLLPCTSMSASGSQTTDVGPTRRGRSVGRCVSWIV